jgi:acyl-CoA hydrolase
LAGDIVEVRSRVLEVGEKSLRFLHEMLNIDARELAASCELTGVHMDRRERKAVPFPEAVRHAALANIAAAGSRLRLRASQQNRALDFSLRSGTDISACPRMSALPPKADVGTRPRHVRFVPQADITQCSKNVVIRSPRRHGRAAKAGK